MSASTQSKEDLGRLSGKGPTKDNISLEQGRQGQGVESQSIGDEAPQFNPQSEQDEQRITGVINPKEVPQAPFMEQQGLKDAQKDQEQGVFAAPVSQPDNRPQTASTSIPPIIDSGSRSRASSSSSSSSASASAPSKPSSAAAPGDTPLEKIEHTVEDLLGRLKDSLRLGGDPSSNYQRVSNKKPSEASKTSLMSRIKGTLSKSFMSKDSTKKAASITPDAKDSKEKEKEKDEAHPSSCPTPRCRNLERRQSGANIADVGLAANPFYELMYKTSVRALIPGERKLISVSESDNVEDALAILSQNGVLSAPVFDAKDMCLGAVDMMDIIAYINKMAPAAKSAEDLSQVKLSDVPITKVIGLSGRNPLTPFFMDNPISMLVELFSTGIHRAALFEASQQLVTTCSQTDVVRWLANLLNAQTLSEAQLSYMDYMVSDLNLGQQKVVTISAKAPVKDALKLLGDVSSVAVVNNRGELIGNFSETQCRGLHRSHEKKGGHFEELFTPVQDFLVRESPKALRPVVGQQNDTLGDVIRMASKTRAHRIWIVDSKLRPIHIISLTDIMGLFASGEPLNERQTAGDIHTLWREPKLEI